MPASKLHSSAFFLAFPFSLLFLTPQFLQTTDPGIHFVSFSHRSIDPHCSIDPCRSIGPQCCSIYPNHTSRQSVAHTFRIGVSSHSLTFLCDIEHHSIIRSCSQLSTQFSVCACWFVSVVYAYSAVNFSTCSIAGQEVNQHLLCYSIVWSAVHPVVGMCLSRISRRLYQFLSRPHYGFFTRSKAGQEVNRRPLHHLIRWQLQ